MRYSFLIGLLAFFHLTSIAQSFNGPTSATSGTTVTLIAASEKFPFAGTTDYEFTAVTQIYDTETTLSYQGGTYNYGYVSQSSITSVDQVHGSSQLPTTIKLYVSNTLNSPVTATFQIHASYNKGTSTGVVSYSNVTIPYTITINPSTTTGGGSGGSGTPIGSIFYGSWASIPSAYTNVSFDYTIAPLISGTKIPMTTGVTLQSGQSIYSPNGKVRLAAQTDGNLVIYRKNANNTETALWASNTSSSSAYQLKFQTDAHLVWYSLSGNVLWSSQLWNNPGSFFTGNLGSSSANYPFFYLQDDGNLVLYWPSVDPNNYKCYVVFLCSDTGGLTVSPHFGTLLHTATSSNRYPGFAFQSGTAN